jgi:hypothetical protein
MGGSMFSEKTPSCCECALYLPVMGVWQCCSFENRKSKPEQIEDTEDGNCRSFAYRSIRTETQCTDAK